MKIGDRKVADVLSWVMQWTTIRAASREGIEVRNLAMREVWRYGLLSVSDIADAARLSPTQTHRILSGEAS